MMYNMLLLVLSLVTRYPKYVVSESAKRSLGEGKVLFHLSLFLTQRLSYVTVVHHCIRTL
jgi:hypothetical protein